jgi:hypothetical protein
MSETQCDDNYLHHRHTRHSIKMLTHLDKKYSSTSNETNLLLSKVEAPMLDGTKICNTMKQNSRICHC